MDRRNPLIKKKGRGTNTTLVMGDKPLREIAALEKLPDYNQADTNVLLLPALHEIPGGMSLCFLQNYFPTTQIAYFVKDPQDKDAAVQAIQSGKLGMLMFNRHRPSYGSPGTIEQFWSGKGHRKLTNFLIGAIQFFKVPEDPSTVPSAKNFLEPGNPDDWVKPGDLVITHMSTKGAYRRGGLNTYMVRTIADDLFNGDFKRLIFEDFTPDGKAFAKRFEQRFPRYGTIYHFGKTPSGSRKVYPLDYFDGPRENPRRRKVETFSTVVSEAIEALKKEFKSARSTRVDYVITGMDDESDEGFDVIYHATTVAQVRYAGDRLVSCVLNTNGHRTSTTKARINDVLRLVGLPVRVYQQDFKWFIVNGVPSHPENVVEFMDGVDVARVFGLTAG